MRIDNDKLLDKLVAYIERWFGSGQNRNIGMLARLSGVTAQTIRRILQRENEPELETCLCLLNIVSTPDETLSVLGGSQALNDFVKRVSSVSGEKKSPDADEVAAQLFNRERFWNFTIAMAVGVTREIIEKLCGAYGLFELEKMIEENILYERIPGRFFPAINQDGLVVEHKDNYSRATCHISELAVMKDTAQKLFMVFNVNHEAFSAIKEKYLTTYSECIEIAKASPGDIVIATSVVNTTVLGE
jgi:transcriptional regulator with XRE-family HTH domain